MALLTPVRVLYSSAIDPATATGGTPWRRLKSLIVKHSKCSPGALDALGGTGGVASEHQCRFVQSLYETPGVISEQVGLCVPVTNASGGSFGDCRLLDWDGIKTALAEAQSRGLEQQEALDEFCLVNPEDPVSSPVKDICRGLYRGCLSLQEMEAGLAP